MSVSVIDLKVITFLRKSFLPVARVAIFIIYFWFGFLKLFDLSPAGPLAAALTAKTVGLEHFNVLFRSLGLYECLVGILFLIPRATRIVIPLLFLHLIIVCSPLILLSGMVWIKPFVPTLEGQYIIKNVVVIALAIGIAAQTVPLKRAKSR